MTQHIERERQDRVLVIRINRQDKLNALTHEMYAAIADGLEEAASDAAIRAVVITAHGDFFTAGNDISDFAKGMPEGKPPVMRFLEGLRDAPKPVIAGVNGAAIGVGLTLLLHCDLSFAAENATFRAPFPQIGLVPEAGSSLLLPRALGMAWANDILLAGRTLNAEEALSAGLISRIYPSDELHQNVLATAQELASYAPNAIRKSKELIRTGRDAVTEQMMREGVHFGAQLKSPEFAEAAAAFREKRPPQFD
ncbi:MAG: enoyl-CoA hydratase [Acidobacteriota bacterium]